VESARPHIDRVDLAPAQHAQHLVAGLLQRQALAHHVAMRRSHLDAVGKAEEIGRMQHDDMESVALDPFTAIDEPPQRAELAFNLDAEGRLDGMHRTHLVGDGADAANARHDIGRLFIAAPAQQGLEKARWLEDAQGRRRHLPVGNGEVERALAFDPGQIVNLYSLSRHGLRFPCGTPRQRH